MNESITNMRVPLHSHTLKWLVPFVSSHRGMAAFLSFGRGAAEGFFFLSSSALTQIVGYVGNCMAEIRRPPDSSLTFLPPQSISALNLGVGRNTSESSRACSCWPACLLLWKRQTRPISEGWSGSAGRGTWRPA